MSTFFGINLHQVSKRLADALNYWGTTMRSVLPRRLQSSLIVGNESLSVVLYKDRIVVVKDSLGQVNVLYQDSYQLTTSNGFLSPDLIECIKKNLTSDTTLNLVIAGHQILSKPVDFPLAVLDNLHQVLMYEMEKHTPLPKQNVLFDTQIKSRYDTTFSAMLYILPADRVMPILNSFLQAKIRFDRLCAEDALTINLLPQALRRRHSLWRFRQQIGFGCCVLLLSALLFALPLYFKRSTAIQLDSEIARLFPDALGEPELWEIRDDTEQLITTFIEHYPIAFINIYEELNRILPDTASINMLAYNHGAVSIRGEAKDAAGLIMHINNSPWFSNARIMSPIVLTRSGGKETFNIAFDAVTTNANRPPADTGAKKVANGGAGQ